jgi:hypothetical protein
MQRITLLLAATLVLSTTVTVACEKDEGANACEAAGQRLLDKYEECNIELQSGEGGEGGEPAECTDAAAMQANCFADCTEEAECIALDPMADPLDPAYADAVAAYGECAMGCG